MTSFDNPHAIFVYGTLKRGQERAGCWPSPPITVEVATTRGTLFDLGPYPAMLPGNDIVLGEIWQLRPQDMPETLRVLDEIECYGNSDVDLYIRRVVECETFAGKIRAAFAYFLANPNETQFVRRVEANQHGHCEWP